MAYFVHFNTELQWFPSGPAFVLLESPYKNKVFVNCMFILARNYKVFMVDMDSVVQVDMHFNQELQWFRGGHGFFSSSESSF